jgi:hypothetical protein
MFIYAYFGRTLENKRTLVVRSRPASRSRCRLDRQSTDTYCFLPEHNNDSTLKVILHHRKVVDEQASLLDCSSIDCTADKNNRRAVVPTAPTRYRNLYQR